MRRNLSFLPLISALFSAKFQKNLPVLRQKEKIDFYPTPPNLNRPDLIRPDTILPCRTWPYRSTKCCVQTKNKIRSF